MKPEGIADVRLAVTGAATNAVIHAYAEAEGDSDTTSPRRALATEWGNQLYLRRQGSTEPVFGQLISSPGANRFLRCGRSTVRSEWRLLTATHNLLKLHRHQLATA